MKEQDNALDMLIKGVCALMWALALAGYLLVTYAVLVATLDFWKNG